MGLAQHNEIHECADCGERRAHKPIAHQDALDEPIGHICLMCYAGWVQLADYEGECVVCGDDAEYHTVRELTDFDGEPVLTTGKIGACDEHALECAGLKAYAPPTKLH